MKIKMILRKHVSSKINEAVLLLLVLERFLSQLYPPSLTALLGLSGFDVR